MSEKKTKSLAVLMCIYCVFTVVQNLFEMKTIGTTTLSIMGGGTIVSWIPFIVGDITAELYGKETSIKSFTLAGILNAIVVVLAQIAILLPGTYIEQNEAFELIFSNGIRTAVASFVAFWIGNYINTKIMVDMKAKAPEGNKLWFFARAVISTLAGQFLDNGIFLILAFAPIGLSVFEMKWVDIFTVTITGTFIETLIETFFVPIVTIPISEKLRKSFE